MTVRKIAVVVATCVALLSFLPISCRPTEESGPRPEPSFTATAALPTKAAVEMTTGLATPVAPPPASVTPSPTPTPTLAGATPSVTATPSPSATSSPVPAPPLIATLAAPAGEPPIVVISGEDEDSGTTLHLTCLNCPGQAAIGSIRSSHRIRMAGALRDDRGNLYILTGDLGTGYNPVLYLVAPDGALKEIALRRYVDYSLYSLHGKVIVATNGSIGIIEDSSVRTIRFRDIGSYILVEGQEGEVIALGKTVVQENGKPYLSPADGKPFAQVVSIDLDSGQVTEKLLPAPQTEGVTQDASIVPGVRYGFTFFIGASPDLRRLYYTYAFVKETGDHAFYTALGVFDTEEEQDLPAVYDECCPPFDGYRQYRDYLMVSHFPEAGGGALLVNMKDLSPVVDIDELLKKDEGTRGLSLVLPFGKYFIVGADSQVFLLSPNGDLLREYPLPSDLIGKKYTIVAYFGDD